jgi:putative FmdB family regulatory protein
VPIYEYQCDNCSYHFEVKQSIKDDPIATCERCGKPVRRLISSPGIMFKGSGWYVTDYSNKLKPPSEGEKSATTDGQKKEASASSTTTTTSSPTNPASSSAGNPSSSSTPTSSSSTSNSSNK